MEQHQREIKCNVCSEIFDGGTPRLNLFHLHDQRPPGITVIDDDEATPEKQARRHFLGSGLLAERS